MNWVLWILGLWLARGALQPRQLPAAADAATTRAPEPQPSQRPKTSKTGTGARGASAAPRTRSAAQKKPRAKSSAPKPSPAPTMFDDVIPPAPVPAPAPAPARASDSQLAAQELFVLVKSSGGMPRRAAVAPLQRRMTGLDVDGLPGEQTRARADALAGQSLAWPPVDIAAIAKQPIPPPPDAATAARELAAYWNVYGGRRPARIAVYQRALGVPASGALTAETRAATERYGSFTWSAP